MQRGGLYLWRVQKPHALLGWPIIGRHNGYAGMTNSYSAREGQHLTGSVAYGTAPASWSDLKPKCYKILPLPRIFFGGKRRRRIIVKPLETIAIYLLLPVYNDLQQAPWNLRKISKEAARRGRANRDDYGTAYRAMRFALRMAINATLLGVFFTGIAQEWWL